MNLAKSNVVLLVAALVLAVPTAVQVSREAESFVDYARIPLLFDGFSTDNVGFVALGQPKKEQPPANPQTPNQKPPVQYDQIVLQRTDKGWVIAPAGFGQPPNELAGAPVMKDRVENDVFLHLGKIRCDRQALVQANATPEQLAEFGLDPEHAMLIKVSDKNGQTPVAELYVGREAAGTLVGSEAVRGVFVRKTDSTDVVLYEYERHWRRDVDQNQWLDKILLKLEPDKATRLSLRNTATGGETITVARADGKASWTCEKPPAGRGALRQTEVEGVLQRLRWVAAQEFHKPLARAGDHKALGLDPAQIALEVTFRDGDAERTVKFGVGNKVDGKAEYWMTCSENQFLMTWPLGVVTPFEANPADQWFDPPAPSNPEPGKEPGKDDGKPGEKKD